MKQSDDHVIPHEVVVRKRLAIEEAKRQKASAHELKLSDAMSHLLEGGEQPVEDSASPSFDGASPASLRRIVEREFTDEGSNQS